MMSEYRSRWHASTATVPATLRARQRGAYCTPFARCHPGWQSRCAASCGSWRQGTGCWGCLPAETAVRAAVATRQGKTEVPAAAQGSAATMQGMAAAAGRLEGSAPLLAALAMQNLGAAPRTQQLAGWARCLVQLGCHQGANAFLRWMRRPVWAVLRPPRWHLLQGCRMHGRRHWEPWPQLRAEPGCLLAKRRRQQACSCLTAAPRHARGRALPLLGWPSRPRRHAPAPACTRDSAAALLGCRVSWAARSPPPCR